MHACIVTDRLWGVPRPALHLVRCRRVPGTVASPAYARVLFERTPTGWRRTYQPMVLSMLRRKLLRQER